MKQFGLFVAILIIAVLITFAMQCCRKPAAGDPATLSAYIDVKDYHAAGMHYQVFFAGNSVHSAAIHVINVTLDSLMVVNLQTYNPNCTTDTASMPTRFEYTKRLYEDR